MLTLLVIFAPVLVDEAARLNRQRRRRAHAQRRRECAR